MFRLNLCRCGPHFIGPLFKSAGFKIQTAATVAQPEQQQQQGLRSQWGYSRRCWMWSTRGELMWRTWRKTFMHPTRFINKLLLWGFTVRCEMRVLRHPHQRSGSENKRIAKKEKKKGFVQHEEQFKKRVSLHLFAILNASSLRVC